MMKELLNGGVWNKTKQLIEEKYGKKIEFRFLTVIESQLPFFSDGDDLVVPLNSRHKYLGDVVIQRAATLSVNEKLELLDLVQFLIEPQVYNLHLKTVQTCLNSSSNSDQQKPLTKSFIDKNSNIVSLFKDHEFHASEDVEQSQFPEIKKTISHIIHLKSKHKILRQKVALEIHEISGSQFFIPLEDISKSIHSIEDLKSLEGATIYIDHILSLTKPQIEILADFAKSTHSFNLQFLVGSDLTDKEIHSLPCHDQLKNDLIGFTYEIDRIPTSQQTQKEVLELLFFSFDQSIS